MDQIDKELLVVKVGTGVLTDMNQQPEQLDNQSFANIGGEIRQLSAGGKAIILVSSGAITAGIAGEGKSRSNVKSMPELQRYAARGWGEIVQSWKTSIGPEKISSTLLTKREISSIATRNKLLGAICCCMEHDDVFLVNENDCISDDEIKFGDNDTLAADLATQCAVSGLFSSTQLVLLTNKNGLNRVAEDDTTLIKTVTDITSVESFAESTSCDHGRGGMTSKLLAAKTASRVGIETFIANGRAEQVIGKTLSKQTGTYIAPKQ